MGSSFWKFNTGEMFEILCKHSILKHDLKIKIFVENHF